MFSNQKSQFGKILKGLAMEDVGIFYGHFVYMLAKLYTLWPLGKYCGHLAYFSGFGMLYREKSGNPETNSVL
jgi:hypothetical protein